jgi:16S rRNA (uracil1498-N3)-methyltransferase
MLHRIYTDIIAPTVTVSGDEFHHSIRVVRVRVGEEVELFDASGALSKGIVESIERDQAVIRTTESIPSRESTFALHLAMSIIQLEKFELVLQKATELGVRSIIPLITERIEVRSERYAGKEERWRRIVFEAVKQSGRSVPPVIEEPAEFRDVIARAGTRVIFEAGASKVPIENAAAMTIFIGPEGGWTDEELELARSQGCIFQSLGPRRLRAETAAIVAASIMSSRFGDL